MNVVSDYDPRKEAFCKTCRKTIQIVAGTSPYSSFTRGLKYHLKTHIEIWEDYLYNLSKIMIPDTKTVYEHFRQMDGRLNKNNKEESLRRLRECQRNSMFSPKNSAKVQYSVRDSEFLKNNFSKLAKYENAAMFKYLFKFTNRNLTLYDLMGTKHPNANPRTNYKQSKCLVDNINNLTIDLERYLCEYSCFVNPLLYNNCPNNHTGDIAIFKNQQFQSSFPGFKNEIEKYPEFQEDANFNDDLLKNTAIIEHDKRTVVEMNLLLKIIITMVDIRKKKIGANIDQLISASIDENNLQKPELAIQMWGPRFSNVDIPEELDVTGKFEEMRISTFQHVNNADCTAYKDNSKKIYTKPFVKNGKVFYPCNVGGCAKACECPPCQNGSEMRCPDHHPDHPEMFNPEEDLHHSRRILFN